MCSTLPLSTITSNAHQNHKNGGVLELQDFFDLPCLNVIWRLVCGRRFDYNDERLPKLIKALEES